MYKTKNPLPPKVIGHACTHMYTHVHTCTHTHTHVHTHAHTHAHTRLEMISELVKDGLVGKRGCDDEHEIRALDGLLCIGSDDLAFNRPQAKQRRHTSRRGGEG